MVTSGRDECERTFNICWGGVYNCTRAFLPMLQNAEEGHIVNTSSINGFWASVGPRIPHTAYSAAKFAVKGFVSPERSPARAADRSNNRTHERRDGNFRRPQRAVRASAQPRQGRVGASVGNLGFVSTLAVTLGPSLNNGLGGALVVPAMIARVGAFVGVAIGKALPSRLRATSALAISFPTPYLRAGELQHDVQELIMLNCQVPRERLSDLRAQMAANRLGVERMQALCRKYGTDIVLAVGDALQDCLIRPGGLLTLP